VGFREHEVSLSASIIQGAAEALLGWKGQLVEVELVIVGESSQ